MMMALNPEPPAAVLRPGGGRVWKTPQELWLEIRGVSKGMMAVAPQ